MDNRITRRDLLGAAALTAACALSGTTPAHAQAAPHPRFKLIAFSKPFQDLKFDQTAELVAEVGWDGIECPVRAKGQIEPERVEEDLPALAEALKKRNREILIITTDVDRITPLNERVLRTASKLGIRKFRTAHWKYVRTRSIPDQLAEFAARCRDIAAMSKELGIQAGLQNHSGRDYFGAPIWDIYSIVKDHDTAALAAHFDIGHATIEGGLSWPIQARLMQPYLGAVYVKDFNWEKTPAGGRERWCPLGEGMVNKSFFDELKKSTYAGPISQHHEYFKPGTSTDEMLASYKHDLQVLRSWLA